VVENEPVLLQKSGNLAWFEAGKFGHLQRILGSQRF
jgi:hypothetical protein